MNDNMKFEIYTNVEYDERGRELFDDVVWALSFYLGDICSKIVELMYYCINMNKVTQKCYDIKY